MKFDLGQSVDILQRTPGVLRGLLEGLSDPWIRSNYGPETFSPFDVVGHLIQGELTDWLPRLRLILEHGPSRPFDPFDRYAMYQSDRGKSIGQLLDEFHELRRRNLDALQSLSLTARHLELRGTHPALGPVALAQLLATWVVHDLNHIAQVCKALAFQYGVEVGPWSAYLSILKPPSPAD